MSIEMKEHSSIQIGSSRSFGLVFAVVFSLIGLYPLINDHPIRMWSIIIAGGFFILSFVAPKVLEPLNILWFKFGLLLARFINPVVMLIIYVIAILPTGLLLKLFGKDLLLLKFDNSASSYWIERKPPGPKPDSLEEQF